MSLPTEPVTVIVLSFIAWAVWVVANQPLIDVCEHGNKFCSTCSYEMGC